MKRINIAIDGHSACGKSTTAKAVAEHLGYTYIDTGAMYRAVTYYLMKHHIGVTDDQSLQEALGQIHIEFRMVNGKSHTFLNGEDVESVIRTPEIAAQVSTVSAVSAVRRAMVEQQQAMGAMKGVVMDGRDIGTVVFPDAELKVFMTADPDIRAERRRAELLAKGIEDDVQTVKANLLHRDELDSTREDSPLRQAADAIVIDTSHISPEDQVFLVLEQYRRMAKSWSAEAS
jgi:CMP/dCMP kinase